MVSATLRIVVQMRLEGVGEERGIWIEDAIRWDICSALPCAIVLKEVVVIWGGKEIEIGWISGRYFLVSGPMIVCRNFDRCNLVDKPISFIFVVAHGYCLQRALGDRLDTRFSTGGLDKVLIRFW